MMVMMMSNIKGFFRKNPKMVLKEIREEQLKERERLDELKRKIMLEIKNENELESKESAQLSLLGRKGRKLKNELFAGDELLCIRKLIRKAKASSRKEGLEYYKDIYTVYQTLPKSKKSAIHEEVMQVYQRIA